MRVNSLADDEKARQDPPLGDAAATTPSLDELQRMLEIAMLAAFAGLAYTLFTTVGLDKYIGYFLPLAPIVAALRNGSLVATQTVAATVLLLLALQVSLYSLLHHRDCSKSSQCHRSSNPTLE